MNKLEVFGRQMEGREYDHFSSMHMEIMQLDEYV